MTKKSKDDRQLELGFPQNPIRQAVRNAFPVSAPIRDEGSSVHYLATVHSLPSRRDYIEREEASKHFDQLLDLVKNFK